MLATRIGLARAMERSDEDAPLVDVVLALSASTAAMIALLDMVAGTWPVTAVPGLVILVAHRLHRRRVGIVAAILVWGRILTLSGAADMLTPLAMIGICGVLLAGPDRVLDWVEVRLEARAERLRLEREARHAAPIGGEGVDAVGWIEDLPDPR